MRVPGPIALLLLSTLCAGCDRDEEAADRREPGQPTAALDAPTPEPEETEAPDPKTHMQEHDQAARRARAALIEGHPERAREGLAWLATHTYPETLPPAWRAYASAMRDAAERGRQATTLRAAASALGALGVACGGCHERVDGGPTALDGEFSVPVDEDLPERMQRHAWAVERLWEGLVLPSEEAWQAGARVLRDGRLGLPGQYALSDAVKDELSRVQQLGRAAAREESWPERGAAYANLLAACARCHRASGGGVNAVPGLPPSR